MSFFSRKRTWIIIGVVVVIGLIIFFVSRKGGSSYQFVTVNQGTITQVVSVTGNTTPSESLNLGFENGGTISQVIHNVGDTVTPGEVIATLNTSDLQAQLASAQANVQEEQAQLANLQAGAQPADIQASQAALGVGQQDLTNMYANAANTLTAAYADANDAVRNQLAAFFTNPESANPQLTFTVNDSQVQNDAQSERAGASDELNTWQSELTAISSTVDMPTLDTALTAGAGHLTVIKNFFVTMSTALVDSTGISPATVNTYKTNVTTAVNEINTATTNVNTLIQNIASQKLTVSQLQAELNLKLAGSTADQIAAQQAQVAQAQAAAQEIQVKINEASLVSPIDGVITVQNAEVGEIAQPGATMTSINSNSALEVDAYVPETDIGKVSVGDPVDMTFDAFQGQDFTGKVFYINPAQTILSGVVDYEIKVSFDTVDPQMKAGLTANLNIDTQTVPNALILPQYAILQNDSGTFVEVLVNGNVTDTPVVTGIEDLNGNVQVASGVTAGEQVLNIGLKSAGT